MYKIFLPEGFDRGGGGWGKGDTWIGVPWSRGGVRCCCCGTGGRRAQHQQPHKGSRRAAPSVLPQWELGL
ncbi:hypothetical protein AGIG_G9573 [Arapaima gigas]